MTGNTEWSIWQVRLRSFEMGFSLTLFIKGMIWRCCCQVIWNLWWSRLGSCFCCPSSISDRTAMMIVSHLWSGPRKSRTGQRYCAFACVCRGCYSYKPKFHYADFVTKSTTSSRQSRGLVVDCRELVADTNHESLWHKSRRRLSWFVSAIRQRLWRELGPWTLSLTSLCILMD